MISIVRQSAELSMSATSEVVGGCAKRLPRFSETSEVFTGSQSLGRLTPCRSWGFGGRAKLLLSLELGTASNGPRGSARASPSRREVDTLLRSRSQAAASCRLGTSLHEALLRRAQKNIHSPEHHSASPRKQEPEPCLQEGAGWQAGVAELRGDAVPSRSLGPRFKMSLIAPPIRTSIREKRPSPPTP